MPSSKILFCGENYLAKASEPEILEQICKEAAIAKRIRDADLDRLSAAFGQRFTKAWEAVKDKRVKKYVFKPSNRVVWIVVGKGRDYLIMPAADFCTCDDFYFRVMDRQIHLCYHLIAQKLAATLENYELYEEEDGLYDVLMREWRKAIA
jgi:predicted nucleic acid-binding Zn finger protein